MEEYRIYIDRCVSVMPDKLPPKSLRQRIVFIQEFFSNSFYLIESHTIELA